LRDLSCGYLDPDLRATADEILLESIDELEARARDRRERGDERSSGTARRPAAGFDVAPASSDAVTPSADWGHEAPYGTPV
jgi:hypothetical protein